MKLTIIIFILIVIQSSYAHSKIKPDSNLNSTENSNEKNNKQKVVDIIKKNPEAASKLKELCPRMKFDHDTNAPKSKSFSIANPIYQLCVLLNIEDICTNFVKDLSNKFTTNKTTTTSTTKPAEVDDATYPTTTTEPEKVTLTGITRPLIIPKEPRDVNFIFVTMLSSIFEIMLEKICETNL